MEHKLEVTVEVGCWLLPCTTESTDGLQPQGAYTLEHRWAGMYGWCTQYRHRPPRANKSMSVTHHWSPPQRKTQNSASKYSKREAETLRRISQRHIDRHEPCDPDPQLWPLEPKINSRSGFLKVIIFTKFDDVLQWNTFIGRKQHVFDFRCFWITV